MGDFQPQVLYFWKKGHSPHHDTTVRVVVVAVLTSEQHCNNCSVSVGSEVKANESGLTIWVTRAERDYHHHHHRHHHQQQQQQWEEDEAERSRHVELCVDVDTTHQTDSYQPGNVCTRDLIHNHTTTTTQQLHMT